MPSTAMNGRKPAEHQKFTVGEVSFTGASLTETPFSAA
jgi:hypothetical protein